MAEHIVTFDVASAPVRVATGTLLVEAAQVAGIEIAQPCGGQGRCGRCAVLVLNGGIRRRSTLRLSPQDVAKGMALACQAVVEGDVAVVVPPQEQVERRLTTDLSAAAITIPPGYHYSTDQVIRRVTLTLPPPQMDDQTDDWSRLQMALRQQARFNEVQISLPLLRQIGAILRQGEWRVTATLDSSPQPGCGRGRLIALQPGFIPENDPLWGVAIDIGTTTVSLWLVDLHTGQVVAQTAEYNQQIKRGEDVISRIIYASKNHSGGEEMRHLVLETINTLLERVSQKAKIEKTAIMKATVVGNSTMIHLLLGIPAASIRLTPFITALNHPPVLLAQEVGVAINAAASIDCLPGVASYVGADISAGVLSSGMAETAQLSLFMDIGTNGEIVLGTGDWLVTCACSAGPAFEGAGVQHGMRATRGAIEEVWINSQTCEPTYRVIGNGPAQGLCGSGLISLLAELFLTGLLDKGGHFHPTLPTKRVREGAYGLEYVVAWAHETHNEQDIVITSVDVNNLLRAKAAIYAGFTVLADAVGVPLESVEQVLIGGAFGKYINVEKAVQMGLLPDMPWDHFHFLGNTAIKGAYLALLDHRARACIADIAQRMTYVELSADNSFYEAFTSALFLPHTDLSRFPSVVAAVATERAASPEVMKGVRSE